MCVCVYSHVRVHMRNVCICKLYLQHLGVVCAFLVQTVRARRDGEQEALCYCVDALLFPCLASAASLEDWQAQVVDWIVWLVDRCTSHRPMHFLFPKACAALQSVMSCLQGESGGSVSSHPLFEVLQSS